LDFEMTLTAAPRATGPAAWADALLLSFGQAGYVQAEPAILQPAEPFLDLSGEDIRKSLYLTTDASGEELCLRPDLTIPVARDYLASPRAGQPAGFCYLGPVFRYRGGRPSEFLQAGIESFGRQDRAAADAEMLALALVTDLMSIAGTTNVGGRTVAEIADRFLEQSTLKGGALPRDALGIIKRFLAISGDPGDAVTQLRALARDAKLGISAAIDQFESRVGFMAARGIDTKATRFSTAFGRGVDYYTGFEFELHAKGDGVEPLVAGGRYDGLMTQLGAPSPIPAVGFSVWVEALTKIGRKPGANASGRRS
jgi:ATP phosphoribosyltransferase regulatory subunit HisZ